MDRPFSLYAVLNVSPGAPARAIEASYRMLMKKHHPDQAGPEESGRAAEINAAFAILRDPVRRASYDRQEQGRQRAMIEAQVGMLRRRRRTVGWAGWGVSAALICAATAVAADRYGGVPARSVARAAAERGQAPQVRLDLLEPAPLVGELFVDPRKLAVVPPPAPPRQSPASVDEASRPMIRSLPRPLPHRTAEAPSAAQESAGDFLERHELIY